MDLNNHIFDFAQYLLKPNIGQKHLKDIIKEFSKGNFKLEKSSEDFKKNILNLKIKIIPYWDSRYPPLLKEISDFPPLLFFKGDENLLKKNMVTIVGTRKMDEYGLRVLEDLFKFSLKFSNLCFVSGLANGVDSCVHRFCLKKNISTVGIIAGGIEKAYYRGNTEMYRYMCQYRLVVSEFPPGRRYFKGMFPLRNRIIAGLASKTFVIQAGSKSGALNTATHANTYGRDVFVVPHDIYSNVGNGCLKLIQDGSGIVLNIDDFVDKVVK